MISVMDQVFIIPSRSLKFGGRWGEIIQVSPQNHLPLLVRFDGADTGYRFDYNEVVSLEQYGKIADVPTFCGSCGTDITGQFVAICESCEDTQFEEDMAAWQQLKR
jgi:hypothetical protein